MEQQDDSDDPWSLDTLQQNLAPGEGLHLSVETIEGLEPLDDQFGVHPPKTVPDVLYEPLFGQPKPTEAEIGRYGRADAVPPMQTYAVLDAAKVFGLPEMLNAARLEHRCLFKGDAYDEMKDVAPWIVRLEEGDKFTRHLFTRGKAPWYLWGKDPGIYIRSRADLDTLWRHFRKFTRVQDENGKWFYLRFWEPHALTPYAKSDVSPFSSKDIFCVIGLTNQTATLAYPCPIPKRPGPPVLTTADRARHDDCVTVRYADRLSRDLFGAMPGQVERLSLSDAEPIKNVILNISKTLASVKITRAPDVARVSVASLFYGAYFLRDPRIIPIAKATLGDKSSAGSVRVLRFDTRLQETARHQIVVTSAGLERLIRDLKTLAKTGRLPPLSAEHSGLTSEQMRSEFWKKCEDRWRIDRLANDENSLQKQAYFRTALMWGPYFLHDPLHRSLAGYFKNGTGFDIHDFIRHLQSRLN